jgi:hypothetical protein
MRNSCGTRNLSPVGHVLGRCAPDDTLRRGWIVNGVRYDNNGYLGTLVGGKRTATQSAEGTRAPFSASPMITSTSMPAMRMLMWGTRIRRRQTTVQFAGGQRPCIQGLSETEHRSASGNPDLLEIASSWFRSYRATSLHSALPVRRCITRTRSPENQRRAEPFTYRDLQQQQPPHGAA